MFKLNLKTSHTTWTYTYYMSYKGISLISMVRVQVVYIFFFYDFKLNILMAFDFEIILRVFWRSLLTSCCDDKPDLDNLVTTKLNSFMADNATSLAAGLTPHFVTQSQHEGSHNKQNKLIKNLCFHLQGCIK